MKGNSCLVSDDFAVGDIGTVLGERFGSDDEAATVLQVQGDALETRSAEHVAVGRGTDGIETYGGEDEPRGHLP